MDSLGSVRAHNEVTVPEGFTVVGNDSEMSSTVSGDIDINRCLIEEDHGPRPFIPSYVFFHYGNHYCHQFSSFFYV